MTDENKIDTGFNWAKIKELMEQEEWQDDYDGQQTRMVLLGTVFNIMPSGKYYMPWACSNVTEEEAEQDAAFMEQLEAEAEEHGYFITSGEADFCDLFVGESRETEEAD
jgi:hypothetical protein